MPEPESENRRIDEMFRQTRRHLEDVGSVLPNVQKQIGNLSIEPSPMRLAWPLATLAALSLAAFLWRRSGEASVPNMQTLSQDFRLDIGDTQMVEHLAAILDHRNVLVIWSYRGAGVSSMPVDAGEGNADKYRLRTLYERRLADGCTIVCSLFIPDQGVHPALQPPTIYTRSADNRLIALSVRARQVSAVELASAIQSIGLDEGRGAGVEDILQKIQQQPR